MDYTEFFREAYNFSHIVAEHCDTDAKTILNAFFGIKMEEHFEIKKVIFNDPATIILWHDGTKTVVKTQNGEKYDPEKGMAMAISKKYFGNTGRYYNIFKKWVPENISEEASIKELEEAVLYADGKAVAHISPIQNSGPVKDYFENGGLWNCSASGNGKYAKVAVVFTFDAGKLVTDEKSLIISAYDGKELNESFNSYFNSRLSLILYDVTVKEINILAMGDTIYDVE